MPVYRSTRDTRNSLLWNPTSKKLLTVEEDEAGRLAAFRAKFGRGFDAASTTEKDAGGVASVSSSSKTKPANDKMDTQSTQQTEAEAASARALAQEEADLQEEEDSLLDLISSFGQESDGTGGKKK